MRGRLIFGNILAVAACALVYELMLGTLASYALGDAVREFSITIGLYLASMGLGAALSAKIGERAAERYVEAELVLAVCGGASVPLLFSFHGGGAALRALVYAAVVVLGTLVGLELPLLVRISKGESPFADAVSRALAYDYAGALVAAIAFPVILVPRLGLVRASLATGALNALCALSATWFLAPSLGARRGPLRAASALAFCGLVAVIFFVNPARMAAE